MKVSFTSDYVRKDSQRFDKLKVKFKETDRVGIVTAPERYYVHQLNMPLVDPTTGEVEQETLKNSRNGEEYERDKTEFVGAYLCQGDEKVLSESADGFDPNGCALCAAIKEYGDKKFRRPEPKYACYVIKYKMSSDGKPQLDPFLPEMFLWVFTQNRFENIIRIANEHGDPMKLDLLLGPCKNENFQAYDISAGGKCFWQEDSERKAVVAKLAKSNGLGTEENTEVIKNTIARQFTPTQAEMDINKILERHSLIGKVGGGTATAMEFGGAVSAANKIDTSNSGTWETASAAPSFAEESPAPAQEAPSAPAETPTPSEGEEDAQDFEALLKSLGG